MKMRIKKIFKTHWPLIWLVAVIVVLVSFSVYAAYMRTQNAKRVISTMGGTGNRFSSNRLEELETDVSAFKFRLMPVPGTVPAEGIDRSLTICNYPQGVEASYYEFNIYYNLEIELTDNQSNPPLFENEAEALTQFYIVDDKNVKHYFTKDSGSGKYLLSISNEELKGRKASNISYIIHFPDVDTGVYMKIYANPTVDNDGTKIRPDDLKSIGALISAVSVTQSQDTNWTGELLEPRESGKNVSDYDAFNYVVSGSGAGTITIKWKSDMLEINPYYAQNESISETITGPDESGYYSLSFDVTADQTISRYSFQMYKAPGSNWSGINDFSSIANIDNLNNPLIIFDFTATAPNTGE